MSIQESDAARIFLDAVENYAPDSRPIFVDDACEGNPQLRARVFELLKAHGENNALLDDEGAIATLELTPIEKPGTQIGPYKLLQQIGEGGFGVVFMGEQERPVRRQVALKVIKPGMDTREVIGRFEAERQALALMDHPNIARVYEAGATDNGRPYFVMELVQGIPITEYCDECNLSTRERLELFIAVCKAVQHAHQKGIIHRDIKPTNVLVAMQDGKPIPKIIDFGVAKAIGEHSLTERTLTSAFAQMIGTPMYMSPEQAELSPLGVDTRSDIYSLGVLLYELLTGNTPFDKDRFHAVPYDELRRIIREEEPLRPSARISTLAADLATTIAEHRRVDARRLGQQVRGELDWIVMKCLEKDRNRRYETPSSLARDIERYLHDEPVQACPPSTAYRLRKYTRRNKVALAVVTLLLSGLAYLAYSNAAIKRERDAKASALAQATTESARSQAVSNFLRKMLGSSYPDRGKDSQYTVRELLDDSSDGLGNEFVDQPEVEAAIRSDIGRSYWRLGVTDRADVHLKRALDLHRQVFSADDQRVANSLIDYAWNLGEQGRFAEVQACVREAVSIYQKLDVHPQVTKSLANALYMQAVAQLRQGDNAGYRETCNTLVDLPVHTDDVMANSRPVWPLCVVPDSLSDMKRLVKRAEEFFAENSRNGNHFCFYVLGAAHYRAGDYELAAQLLEKSIDVYPSSPETGFDTINYQQLLFAMAKWQEGKRDEARQSLLKIQPAVDKELQASSTVWNRRTSLELLRSEAKALIELKQASESARIESLNPKP